jgi:hypothetical protein
MARVVCAPYFALFMKINVKGNKMERIIFKIVGMYLLSSVLTIPGCKETEIPLF